MSNVCSTALEMHIAVTILRVQEGLDYTGIIRDFEVKDLVKDNQNKGVDNPTFENSRESGGIANFPSFGMYLYILFTSFTDNTKIPKICPF